MPAIYGVIDLKGNKIDGSIGEKIHKGYEGCRIDRHCLRASSNAVLGLEQQIITKEDEDKRWDTPIHDDVKKIFFVAEGTLDNRDSLLGELRCDKAASDGYLMYLGYLKWGKRCVSHFRGVFSFAIYDISENKVLLYADYFAGNCLYYFVRDKVLYFSTMLFPIVEASGLKFETNDRWLLEGLTVRGPALMFEPRECAYKGVYKVPAGHFVEISTSGAKEHCYWNPMKKAKYKPDITDKECKDFIRKTVYESTKSCTRTNGGVAVSLSCGLDSTTIAANAAIALEKEGKDLYGFTSVPLKESNKKNTKYTIYDETQGVLELCRMYPNIKPNFVDCRGKNILTEARDIVETWELPCMTQQNGVWTSEINRLAGENNCKILLTGATGNTSISAGRAEEYIVDLVRHFKLAKANKDLKKILKSHNLSGRKPFIKFILKGYKDYIGNYLVRDKKKCYADTVTRRDIGEKYDIGARYYERILKYHPVSSIKDIHNGVYSLKNCAQMGEVETKYCLKYGTLNRDPFRNVELVEFLCTLPMRCFANENHDRRLIREFMEGLIPDSIRLNETSRGLQSGDNAFRISQSWADKYSEVKSVLLSEASLKYIDKDRLLDVYDEIDDDQLEKCEMDVRLIIDAYNFGLYLEKVNKYQ